MFQAVEIVYIYLNKSGCFIHFFWGGSNCTESNQIQTQTNIMNNIRLCLLLLVFFCLNEIARRRRIALDTLFDIMHIINKYRKLKFDLLPSHSIDDIHREKERTDTRVREQHEYSNDDANKGELILILIRHNG